MRREDLNPPAVDGAIRSLRPNVERWDYDHGSRQFTIWEDSQNREPPTYEEILEQIEIDAIKWEYYGYVINREREYGSIKDQLEMIYRDLKRLNFSDGEYVNFIDKIKEKYPKPSISIEDYIIEQKIMNHNI
jgi:hypothetical protein